jgi:Ca2+-binding RTX toxin-like protein
MDSGSKLIAGDGIRQTMDLNGDLVINNATVSVDIRGNGQSDTYNVSGQTNILSGQFDFNFLGSYIPQAGDGFTFLKSAAINVDLNNVQYVLHGISVANTFGFNLASDGNFLTLHTLVSASASDGLIYHGSVGGDVFSATTGHDELYGGVGNDQLSGAAGDDFIVGGLGEDELDGGAGSDKFYYQTPSDGTHTAENILASKVSSGDVISNFDAKVDGGDKLVFNAEAFHIDGVSTLNFIASDAEYDGTAESLTNGVSADYREGNASFIMDGANHLIYDDNGAAAGYTVVATVEVAPGSPAVTHDNLQAA